MDQLDQKTWAELYDNLLEDVRPFERGVRIDDAPSPYIGGWKVNAEPPDVPDAERELGGREVAQNTDVWFTLNRDGLPAEALRFAWQPVLDAARGFRRELDAYVDEHGRQLKPRQKEDAGDTIGQMVDDIIGGK
jgi:hypothetical protein